MKVDMKRFSLTDAELRKLLAKGAEDEFPELSECLRDEDMTFLLEQHDDHWRLTQLNRPGPK